MRESTTTALSLSATQVTYGQPVQFVATVTPLTATGSVDFTRDDGTVLGTATILNGVASLTRADLPVGSYVLRAVYAGNTSFSGSSSSPATLTVSTVSAKPVMVTGVHWDTLKLSKRKKIKVLDVTLSGALDAGSAANMAGYYMGTAGRDKKFGNLDDKRVALASATYNPGAHTIMLRPRTTFPSRSSN